MSPRERNGAPRRSWERQRAFVFAGRLFESCEWRNRRHFWHEGSALSTCLRRTKSPHSDQDAPLGASWVGSVMWVFGFVPIMELRRFASTGRTAALRRSCAILSYGTSVRGGIAGVDGSRTNAPVFFPRPPRSMRYFRPGQVVLIFINSRRQSLRNFWTVTLSPALVGSTPNCR